MVYHGIRWEIPGISAREWDQNGNGKNAEMTISGNDYAYSDVPIILPMSRNVVEQNARGKTTMFAIFVGCLLPKLGSNS